MFSQYPVVQTNTFDQSLVIGDRVEDQHAALAIFLNRAANTLGRPFAHVACPTAYRVLESAITSAFSVQDNTDDSLHTINGFPIVQSHIIYGTPSQGAIETIGLDRDGKRIVSIRTLLKNISF